MLPQEISRIKDCGFSLCLIIQLLYYVFHDSTGRYKNTSALCIFVGIKTLPINFKYFRWEILMENINFNYLGGIIPSRRLFACKWYKSTNTLFGITILSQWWIWSSGKLMLWLVLIGPLLCGINM